MFTVNPSDWEGLLDCLLASNLSYMTIPMSIAAITTEMKFKIVSIGIPKPPIITRVYLINQKCWEFFRFILIVVQKVYSFR